MKDSGDEWIPAQGSSIPHHQAPAAVETSALYGIQSGQVSKTTELFLYREGRYIGAVKVAEKRKGKQTDVATFFTSPGEGSGPWNHPVATSFRISSWFASFIYDPT